MAKFKQNSSKALGSLLQFDKSSSGITAATAQGKLSVKVYSDNIFRVTATQDEEFEDFSYAVIAQPQAIKTEVIDQADHLVIKTAQCQVSVSKASAQLSFQTLQGTVINEDDALGISWIGDQVTNYKKLQHDERFIGLGEKTGALNRRGSSYQNWNTDAYAYHAGSDPLYCSIPFYIGVHNSLVYGIFLDNTHKTFFNFGASNNRFASFSADLGEMNYYFIYGKSVKEIIQHYTFLTGRMEMPPLWGIGYQQCRYSYYPDKEVLTLAKTFREKEIPADAIVLDIHYMEKYKIFTWDKKHFSNPKELLSSLKELGFNIVIMCDPGIKIEKGYEPYDDGVKQDVFIKYPDGENYAGQVWPGWCHFPDFTKPAARKWWASKFHEYVNMGVQGFWNDMNEIATWGNSLPENLEFDFEGNKATTRRGRNLYGFQMARSTYEGTKELLKGKRPFNLTRSGFSGIQRYSAVWTGDNVAYDEHMLLGVRLVNSMGLSGVAFAGYDAGGFVGNADTKLFARWITIASLSPFFRVHSMINTRDSEPWSYGEEVEQISRNAIRFRYQLMPYIYSAFFEASQTGLPVQRSLAIDYTHEPAVYDHQFHNQYLFGPSILVAPVESSKDLLRVYLPEGEWYYLYTGKVYMGAQQIIIDCPIHKLPVFIKGGAILPMQKAAQSTQHKQDELIIHVYAGSSPSEFTYYEDDGETFSYQTGESLKRTIQYNPSERKLSISASEGSFISFRKTIKLTLHGFDQNEVTINTERKALESSIHSFFSPLEKYDPINDPDSMGEENIKSVSFVYTDNAIEITW